jgi:hypothetical protein
MKAARPEGSIMPDPLIKNIGDDSFQSLVQLRETVPQQQTQIDALGAVVKLSFVNG